MSSLTTISSGMRESMEVEELVDTRLSLVIGAGSRPPPPVQALLPLTGNEASAGRKWKKGSESGEGGTKRQRRKQARTVQGGSDVDNDEGVTADGSARKKLRLTTDQAALMEKSFRAHNVLSHGEKNDLARQLGLKPRQVEVWFQNRRARTKLKQTELDCDLLRRWCERLNDENVRLRRELTGARSSSSSSSAFFSRLTSAATVNASCPSCHKPAGGRCPLNTSRSAKSIVK